MCLDAVKKVLVIGFENYDERMYPHTFEVLKTLEEQCELTYFGGDDRGFGKFMLGMMQNPLATRPIVYCKQYWGEMRRARQVERGLSRLMRKTYDTVLTIDHTALNLAARYLQRDSRLIFWSLDYFSQDHLWMQSRWIRQVIEQNQKVVQKCSAIVIQDANRAAVLDSILMSHDIPKFLLPVSINSNAKSTLAAAQRQTRILASPIKLMQLGTIHPVRSSDKLLNAYQKMDGSIDLILHGHISIEIAKAMDKSGRKPMVVGVCNTLKEMRENIDKADIGIIAVSEKSLNSYFFSRASGQLVEFLRLGIPSIVVGSLELGRFVQENGCGVSISDFPQLEWAVQTIKEGYNVYALHSLELFCRAFNFESYRENLIRLVLEHNISNANA